MLLRRYSDISYIMSMDIDFAMEFVFNAFEKENEETIFRMFLHDPYSGLTFDEYKRKVERKPYVKMDDETMNDIVSDAEKIIMRRGE